MLRVYGLGLRVWNLWIRDYKTLVNSPKNHLNKIYKTVCCKMLGVWGLGFIF